MARYYFHLQDGEFVADEEGVELSTLEAAKDAAVQLLVESLKQHSSKFWATENSG